MHLRVLIAALFAALLALPAAAQPTTTAVDPVVPEWGDLDSAIRPGSSIGNCTLNWVFYEEVVPTDDDPDPIPEIYAGTAAHCVSEVGQRIAIPDFGEFGTVVYDSDEFGSTVDFALIEIDAELLDDTNPKMRGWDGPYGFATPDDLAIGDIVAIHGYGMVLGQNEFTRDRFGVLTNWDDDEYVVNMPAVFGDSGSPLIHVDSGLALGIISRFGFFATPPSTDTGPMMPWIFSELDAAGFGDVVLATVAE